MKNKELIELKEEVKKIRLVVTKEDNFKYFGESFIAIFVSLYSLFVIPNGGNIIMTVTVVLTSLILAGSMSYLIIKVKNFVNEHDKIKE